MSACGILTSDMDMFQPMIPGRFVVPGIVTTHFHLREGDTVADFGAGSGYFLQALSEAVGATGRVYACEIQRELVEKLGNTARLQNLTNVDPIWCDIEEPNGVKIASGALDAVVLINTLFQIEDKNTALSEVLRTLRPGGKLLLIDWSESFGGLGPQPYQVVSQSDAQSLVETAGLVFERSFDAGDHHYGLAFKKP